MTTNPDIPFVDETVASLPTDMREELALRGRTDLYFFAKGVLGFSDMAPNCHGPACRFITQNPAQYKLVLWPRDHFKSSVLTIAGTLQKVIQNPELRCLIRNEVATNANRFLRTIRQHAEGNRVFRALYPEIIPKDTKRVRWNDSELDFARKGHYPEPTISAAGITSTTTSQHFNHITDDDPISESAVKSDLEMTEAINRLKGVDALLIDPERDTHWLIGTRWSFADVYSWYEKAYRPRLARFIRGAIEDGEPIFPERFSLNTLAHTRTVVGEYRWSCNYMNNPRNPDIQDLNIEDLRYWEWDAAGDRVILHDAAGQVCDTWRLDELDVTITVDVAPPESKTTNSDRNSIAVCGVSPRNQVVVLESWTTRCTPTELIDQLVMFTKRYGPRKIGIEKATYQYSLKYFLSQRTSAEGLYSRIEPVAPGGKNKPHVRGLQPLMATGRLFIHSTHMILRQEMADYPLGEHDDAVDALALQLQLMKGQLSPEFQAQLKNEERKIMSHIFRPDDETIRRAMDLDPEEPIDFQEASMVFGRGIQEVPIA